MKTKALLLFTLAGIGLAADAGAIVLSNVQYLINPIPSQGMSLNGISGNLIVGSYWSSDLVTHGLVYDGLNWSTLEFPAVPGYNNSDTALHGVAGSAIVGQYKNQGGTFGFLFDGATWASFAAPATAGFGGSVTSASALSGSNIVGYYWVNNGGSYGKGFIYDGSQWTTLVSPLSSGFNGLKTTIPRAIDNNNIVGSYLDTSGKYKGFLYSDSLWTELTFPNASDSTPYGISGNNIVGEYHDQSGARHGFLYDGTTWTTLDTIAGETSIVATDGISILGQDNTGYFAASLPVPEPSSYALLLTAGAAALWRARAGKI